MVKGMVVSGGFGSLLIRQKSDRAIELGELLVSETPKGKTVLHVYDLIYGSQLSQQTLELVSGLKLEEDSSLPVMEPNLRTYIIARAKGLVNIKGRQATACKDLPPMFSEIREVKSEDLSFLTKPETPLFVGSLRSGSKELDVPIYLQGSSVLSHHVLVSATTGKGKSNLAYCMIWDLCGRDYAGMLVLDPHDEYYGRTKKGLKDHEKAKEKVVYYSPDPMPGARSLKINLSLLQPHHFDGVVPWSDAQKECIIAYWKKYGQEWIPKMFSEQALPGFMEGTIAVVRRRLQQLLDISQNDDSINASGVFDIHSGLTTATDITKELESGKIVIVDTSSLSGQAEILIGSILSTEALNKYKHYKQTGELKQKPVISIVLEEAPRVLGKAVLEKGPNIFSTIAREGRKFKVGLVAITQLPSLIPREILANINTKIILGTEMKPERQALIESAAQDLSDDERTIASLDRGEALITSTFVKFTTPIKIPLFETIAAQKHEETIKKDFSELKQ